MISKYSIALVGRTNVGKSSLFNKLVEENQALTSDKPNTTRDRNYGKVVWRGEEVRLIDTGGLDAFDFLDKKTGSDTIERQIIEQTNKSLEEADLLFFVIDGRHGILPQERVLAKILRKINKPTILVCNKIDNNKMEDEVDSNALFGLNLGEISYVSAKTGLGTGDLLDKAYDVLKTIKKIKSRKAKIAENIRPIKIALIGKPNVGKSSMLNTLLDSKHAIVSPIEHTTREPQDVQFNYKQQPFIVVDTAGIRKQARVKKGIETFGMEKSLETLEQADIAVLVIDSSRALSVQDNYLADKIKRSGCGLIMVANKWDLIEDKETNTIKDYEKKFYNFFPYLWWVPIVFASALTKIRVKNILDLAVKINEEKRRTIDPKELEIFTKKFISHFKPTRGKGLGKPRIKEFIQESTNPPTFTLRLYPGADLDKSYLRYVENQVRRAFGFSGVPIRIAVDKPAKKHSAPNQKADSNKRGGSTRPRGVRR